MRMQNFVQSLYEKRAEEYYTDCAMIEESDIVDLSETMDLSKLDVCEAVFTSHPATDGMNDAFYTYINSYNDLSDLREKQHFPTPGPFIIPASKRRFTLTGPSVYPAINMPEAVIEMEERYPDLWSYEEAEKARTERENSPPLYDLETVLKINGLEFPPMFNFDRSALQHDERTMLNPLLESLGFCDITWHTGEADSFGVLTRYCRCKLAGDHAPSAVTRYFDFIYG